MHVLLCQLLVSEVFYAELLVRMYLENFQYQGYVHENSKQQINTHIT